MDLMTQNFFSLQKLSSLGLNDGHPNYRYRTCLQPSKNRQQSALRNSSFLPFFFFCGYFTHQDPAHRNQYGSGSTELLEEICGTVQIQPDKKLLQQFVKISVLTLKTTPEYSTKNTDFASLVTVCNCFLRNQSQKALAINFTGRETKDKYELKGVEHKT
jgi:hypothetical protein